MRLAFLAVLLAAATSVSALAALPKPSPSPVCPPCFDCRNPDSQCAQFAPCNNNTGHCVCPDGFGGADCREPVCGGLPDALRPVRESPECSCRPGWGGINCNMCTSDHACDALMPEGLLGTCYQTGVLVNRGFQTCNVTNAKIVDILKGLQPQVTFQCNRTEAGCGFEFWIGQNELFYCGLEECDFKYDTATNRTRYRCEHARCKCIPGRMLCGQAGLIDISDFLTETIKGPADFLCDVAGGKCDFSEPSMNDLISLVFGDPKIMLECASGECLHYLEIPGYAPPDKSKYLYAHMTVLVGVIVGIVSVAVLLVAQIRKLPLFAAVGDSQPDPEDGDSTESTTLMLQHQPTTLLFKDVGYALPNGASVLSGVSGLVRPRECMAIMGSSGAGKTTLLDILAGKNKQGLVGGSVLTNGRARTPKEYRRMVGFVDQEDCLIPTLTVYETVLNSALLRLPRIMSAQAKRARVREVLAELGIAHLHDHLVGEEGNRGLSGGEKRRVAIACELVTLPAVLFLDEPTSGLDLYNAHNVVASLVRLARNYDRTIVFTIHQPRLDIVAMFDRLLLLSHGKAVYSGEMAGVYRFFSGYGFECPLGYNVVDWLIDQVEGVTKETTPAPVAEDEHAPPAPRRTDTGASGTAEWSHLLSHRREFSDTPALAAAEGTPAGEIYNIAEIFGSSLYAGELQDEIAALEGTASSASSGVQVLPPATASFLTQLAVLCSRTFKNVYRNPRLLFAHYALALVSGLFLGLLYYNVPNDISGFQNRLGLFFFVLALFGFLTLTGLHAFAAERSVFIRERANGYYHPSAYYVAKLVSDVLPMRVLPPCLLLTLIYPLVGLTVEHYALVKALAILVLFNLAASAEVLVVGIYVKDPGVSTMVGVLLLLFSLLFAGLFVNRDSMPAWLHWLQYASVFHYGYEALAVNEVSGLMLREKKYGLLIEVPGATILSTFGFDVRAVGADCGVLVAFVLGCWAVGYVVLHAVVKERR